ncbi:MAG TPA: hypothetical protein VF185_04665 [Patescibacteria group bacterium]
MSMENVEGNGRWAASRASFYARNLDDECKAQLMMEIFNSLPDSFKTEISRVVSSATVVSGSKNDESCHPVVRFVTYEPDKKAYRFIYNYFQENHRPPTHAEIARAMGKLANSSGKKIVWRLANRNIIELEDGARGIKLIEGLLPENVKVKKEKRVFTKRRPGIQKLGAV